MQLCGDGCKVAGLGVACRLWLWVLGFAVLVSWLASHLRFYALLVAAFSRVLVYASFPAPANLVSVPIYDSAFGFQSLTARTPTEGSTARSRIEYVPGSVAGYQNVK